MQARGYQFEFSSVYSETAYDVDKKEQKAKKILAVLKDYYNDELDSLSLIDVGCSTGIIANFLSKRFRYVVGTDIDEPAILFAQKRYATETLQFSVQDGMSLSLPDESLDCAICTHIYEHVPDPRLLISEIYRILVPGGICYFAAGNRLRLIEPHYKLPFLSVLPKFLGHFYLRLLTSEENYYESLSTYWGLRRLVSQFEIIDYTRKIIEQPNKYCATDMLQPGSFKQFVALRLTRIMYWLSPTYVWLLQKPENN